MTKTLSISLLFCSSIHTIRNILQGESVYKTEKKWFWVHQAVRFLGNSHWLDGGWLVTLVMTLCSCLFVIHSLFGCLLIHSNAKEASSGKKGFCCAPRSECRCFFGSVYVAGKLKVEVLKCRDEMGVRFGKFNAKKTSRLLKFNEWLWG